MYIWHLSWTLQLQHKVLFPALSAAWYEAWKWNLSRDRATERQRVYPGSWGTEETGVSHGAGGYSGNADENSKRHFGNMKKLLTEMSPKAREEIQLEIVRNQYLYDVLKRECWDSMKVKGKAIKVRRIRNKSNFSYSSQTVLLWWSWCAGNITYIVHDRPFTLAWRWRTTLWKREQRKTWRSFRGFRLYGSWKLP